MATASILINGDPWAYEAQIGDEVDLSNDDDGDEQTYLWELADIPDYSDAELDDETAASTSFVPDCEGTYLIRLTVDEGLATESIDTAAVYIYDVKDNLVRLPAAGETTEVDSEKNGGWKYAVNFLLKRLNDFKANPGKMVAMWADANKCTTYQAVTFIGASLLKEGWPEEELIVSVLPMLGSYQSIEWMPIGLVTGDATYEGFSVSPDTLCRVLTFGMVPTSVYLPGANVGDPIFIDDSGYISLSPGTYTRCVGHVVEPSGDYAYVFFTNYAYYIGGGGGGS